MENEQSGKIVSLRNPKIEKFIGELWEYPDSYEYCLIPNYEDKFSEVHTDCVQMGDCFANIINKGDSYALISIIFEKNWAVQEIIDWLDRYELKIYPPTTSIITLHKTHTIIDAKLFNGYPLILSERGTKTMTINPSELIEVTDEYEYFEKIINTGLANPVGKENGSNQKHPVVSSVDILNRYVSLLENDTPFNKIQQMDFYHKDVKPLALRIALEMNVEDEICFFVDGTIVILTKMDNEWTFCLPYWNSDVIEYFAENLPPDFTDYLISMK